MSYWTDNQIFNDLANQHTKYGATQIVATRARNLTQDHELLSYSEALSWVITGEGPLDIFNRITAKQRLDQNIQAIVDDTVKYVSDPAVISAINDTIDYAKQHNQLTYQIDGLMDYQIPRVEVLTHMILTKLDQQNIHLI